MIQNPRGLTWHVQDAGGGTAVAPPVEDEEEVIGPKWGEASPSPGRSYGSHRECLLARTVR